MTDWRPVLALSHILYNTCSASKTRKFLINIQIFNFSLKVLKSGNIDFIDQHGNTFLELNGCCLFIEYFAKMLSTASHLASSSYLHNLLGSLGIRICAH